MKRFSLLVYAILFLTLLQACTFAAPYRHLGSVDNPPRVQWFRDFQSASAFKLNSEFHDNATTSFPGPPWGGTTGSNAIQGYVKDLYYDAFGNISAFSLLATITNDSYDYASELVGTDGQNNLGQTAPSIIGQTSVTLASTRLTADFADDGILWNSLGVQSNIYALNYDELAWYGHSSVEPPVADISFLGNYCVPAWRFSDIAPGQSASRELQFALYRHEAPGSAIFGILQASQSQQLDLLSNRSNALKIDNYASVLSADNGAAFPASGSTVSVFFESTDSPNVSMSRVDDIPLQRQWYPILGAQPVEMIHARITSRLSNIAGLASLKLQASGSGNDATDIQNVVICSDANRNGRIDPQEQCIIRESFAADDGSIHIQNILEGFGSAFLIPQNGALDLIVALVMRPSSAPDKTFALRLTEVQVWEAIGLFEIRQIDLTGLSIEGCTLTTAQDPAYLSVRKGVNSPGKAGWWPALGSTPALVLQLSAQAGPSADLRIDSMVLSANGEGDPQSDIASVQAWADANSTGVIDAGDELIGEGAIDPDTGTCVLQFAPGYTVPAGAAADILLALVMADEVDTTEPKRYAIQISEINAIDIGSDQSAAVVGLPLTSCTLLVTGQPPQWTIGEALVSLPEYTWWPSLGPCNNLVASLVLTTNAAEPLSVEDIVLEATGTGNDATDILSVDVWLDSDDNGTLSPNEPRLGSGVFGSDNGRCRISLQDLVIDTAPWGHAGIIVTYKLNTGVAIGSTFRCQVVEGNAEGLESGARTMAQVQSGPGSILRVTSNPPSLALRIGENQPKDSLWNVESEDRTISMMQFDAKCDADRDIIIHSMRLMATGYGDEQDAIETVKVWNDANNDGIASAGDSLLFQGSFNAVRECYLYPAVSALNIPAGAEMHLLVTFDMATPEHVEKKRTYAFVLDTVDGRWIDNQDIQTPVYSLPLSSCVMKTAGPIHEVTIPQARRLAYGTWVKLESKSVTAVFPDTFVIEEPGRTAAITVYAPGVEVAVGDRVIVTGEAIILGPSSYIEAGMTENLGPAAPLKPLGMSIRAAGGRLDPPWAIIDFWNPDSPTLSAGVPKEDLLIRITGRVTWLDPETQAFHVDDGSGIWDGTQDEHDNPVYGMRVECPAGCAPPARDSFVAVTGLCRPIYADLELPDSELILAKRCLTPRDQHDIQSIPE